MINIVERRVHLRVSAHLERECGRPCVPTQTHLALPLAQRAPTRQPRTLVVPKRPLVPTLALALPPRDAPTPTVEHGLDHALRKDVGVDDGHDAAKEGHDGVQGLLADIVGWGRRSWVDEGGAEGEGSESGREGRELRFGATWGPEVGQRSVWAE